MEPAKYEYMTPEVVERRMEGGLVAAEIMMEYKAEQAGTMEGGA